MTSEYLEDIALQENQIPETPIDEIDISFEDFESVYDYMIKNNQITPNFKLLLNRWTVYANLSVVGRGLLDQVYGSFQGFLKATRVNVLEPYIIQFDQNLESQDTVRVIGSRIGLYIYEDNYYEPYEVFVDKLTTIIQEYSLKATPELPSISQIIDMDKEAFFDYANRYSITPESMGITCDTSVDDDCTQESLYESLYQDRLTVFNTILTNS